MANIKQSLGGTTAITCTLTSVGSYLSREGTVVNNTVNLYLDAALMCKLQMSALVTGDIWVTLSSSLDNTNFSNPATGADAAIVVPQLDKLGGEVMGQQHAGTDLIVLGKITAPPTLATTGTVIANFGSVAQAFGGNIMPWWAPVFSNCGTTTLGTTAAGHVIWYDGLAATSI